MADWEQNAVAVTSEDLERAFKQRAMTEAEREATPANMVGRNLRNIGIGIATDVLAPAARAVGQTEFAEELHRRDRAQQQIAAERDRETILPDMLERGGRSVARTLPQIITMGRLGGFPAIAGGIGAQTYERAYDQAISQGADPDAARTFATNQATAEVGTTVAFQQIAPGLEKYFSRGMGNKAAKGATEGFRRGVTEFAKSTGAELAEEEIIELTQMAQEKALGLDPKPATFEEGLEVGAQTAATTLMNMGAAKGIDRFAQGRARKRRMGRIQNLRAARAKQRAARPAPAQAEPGSKPAAEKRPKDLRAAVEAVFADGQPKTMDEVQASLEQGGVDLNDPDTAADVDAILDELEAEGYQYDESTAQLIPHQLLSQGTQPPAEPDFLDRDVPAVDPDEDVRQFLRESGIAESVIESMDPAARMAMASSIEQEQEAAMSRDAGEAADIQRMEAPEATQTDEATGAQQEQETAPDDGGSRPQPDIREEGRNTEEGSKGARPSGQGEPAGVQEKVASEETLRRAVDRLSGPQAAPFRDKRTTYEPDSGRLVAGNGETALRLDDDGQPVVEDIPDAEAAPEDWVPQDAPDFRKKFSPDDPRNSAEDFANKWGTLSDRQKRRIGVQLRGIGVDVRANSTPAKVKSSVEKFLSKGEGLPSRFGELADLIENKRDILARGISLEDEGFNADVEEATREIERFIGESGIALPSHVRASIIAEPDTARESLRQLLSRQYTPEEVDAAIPPGDAVENETPEETGAAEDTQRPEVDQPTPQTPEPESPGQPVAERLNSAEEHLLTTVRDLGELSEDAAHRVADDLLRRKRARLDPGVGRAQFKHGADLEKENLQAIAERTRPDAIEEEAPPETQPAETVERPDAAPESEPRAEQGRPSDDELKRRIMEAMQEEDAPAEPEHQPDRLEQYVADRSNRDKARIRKTLSKKFRTDDGDKTRQQLIEEMVDAGATIETVSDPRPLTDDDRRSLFAERNNLMRGVVSGKDQDRINAINATLSRGHRLNPTRDLVLPDGTSRTQSKLTKTGMDYAAHLLSQPAAPASPPKRRGFKAKASQKKAEAGDSYEASKQRLADAIKSGNLFSGPPLSPEILGAVADVLVDGVRYKAWSFAEIVADLAETFGELNRPKLRPYLERGWKAVQATEDVEDPDYDEVFSNYEGQADDAGRSEAGGGRAGDERRNAAGQGNAGVLEEAPAEDVRAPEARRDPAGAGDAVGRPEGERGGAADNQGGDESGRRGEGDAGLPADGAGERGGGRAGGERGDTADSLSTEAEPKPPTPARPNYHLTDPESIVGGGPKEKFNRNRRAIEAVQAIQAENREPTREELDAMAGYTGWGAFGQELFKGAWDNPQPKQGWEEQDEWLRAHLGESEWKAAQESIINAHYTAPPQVEFVWNILEKFGFHGGRVLEPSMGNGNFFSLMPRHLMEESTLTGIELDKVTAQIAKALHPQANIHQKGYQDSKTPDNFYDAIVSNVPFANVPVPDSKYPIEFSVHNYFFRKALDQVKPGGVMAFITSNTTMDGKTQAKFLRKQIDKEADFVAAYRFPSGAFSKYAGTKVVADLILIRKRHSDESPSGENWSEIVNVDTPSGESVPVNEYWQNHPENIFGTLDFGRGTTSGRPGMIVQPTGDLDAAMERALEELPAGIFDTETRRADLTERANDTDERQNTVVMRDGEPMVVEGEHLTPLMNRVKWYRKNSKPKTIEQKRREIEKLIEVREPLRRVLDKQSRSEDAGAERKALNDAYDAFVDEFGPIDKSQAINSLRKARDPMANALRSLESRNADGTSEKRPVFTRSTTRQKKRPENPTVLDAYAMERNRTLDLDMERVASEAGVTVDEAIEELTKLDEVYKTPHGNYEPADVFLSGNMLLKRRQIQEAMAEGETGLERSLEAVERLAPDPIPYTDIEAKMGATWVTSEDYQQFLSDLIGEEPSEFQVQRLPGRWKVRVSAEAGRTTQATQTYGYPEVPFARIVSAAMNNSTVKVTREDEDGNKVVDQAATEAANAKVEGLREEFQSWIWADQDRIVRLWEAYNEVFNAHVTPEFATNPLAFEGLALQRGDDPFSLRKHQESAVWRGIVSGKGLYGHEVGTGKTLTMGALAMEARRLGIASKPMLFAHNANSASVKNEIQAAYPNAKILYVDNLNASQRDATLGAIATDDWDLIVVPHSLVERFQLKPETLESLLQTQLESLEAAAREAFEEAEGYKGSMPEILDTMKEDDLKELKEPTAKELVKERMRLRAKITKAQQEAEKANTIFFEDMGVDMLTVDEAHIFKKLPISTKQRLKGLNKLGSGRGTSMQLLADYIRGINGGKGIHLFTGTPITNTLNEIFNMQRLVMAEEMKEAGVYEWDGWFNTFASAESNMELSSGGTWEMFERLQSFVNLPELRKMAGRYMDLVFSEEMAEHVYREQRDGRTEDPKGRPYKQIHNETVEMTASQRQHSEELRERYRKFRDAEPKEKKEMMLSGGEHNPLVIEGEGVKLALDPRLLGIQVDPNDPNLKINKMLSRAMVHYHEHPKSTQMIFMETGHNNRVTRTRTTEDGEQVRTSHQVFSVADEIERRLIEEGVPKDQIVQFGKITDKAKRAEAAEKMQRGESRFAIGSTATMGTGVNAQNEMVAMHHLDSPWTPGELEQRNGRGHRQGNRWNTVHEYRYLTEGPQDGRRWQVVLTKDRFIQKFIRGSGSLERTMEMDQVDMGDSGGATDMEQTFSAAAGDPRVLLRAKLERDIDKLAKAKSRHNRNVDQTLREARQKSDEIRESIAERDRRIADYETWQSNQDAPFSITVQGQTVTSRDDAKSLLGEAKDKYASVRGPEVEVGEYRGLTLMTVRGDLFVKGQTETMVGWSVQSIDQTMRNMPNRMAQKQKEIERAQRFIEQADQLVGKPFPKEDLLASKKARLAQLVQEMDANPDMSPAWLRSGAPVGSAVYYRGRDYDVAGHRDDDTVLVESPEGSEEAFLALPASELTTEDGSPLFPDLQQTGEETATVVPEGAGVRRPPMGSGRRRMGQRGRRRFGNSSRSRRVTKGMIASDSQADWEAMTRLRVGTKGKAEPITRKTVASIFPGAKITTAPQGWHAEIGDSFFTIQMTDEIEMDWGAAERTAGYRIPESLRAKVGAAGAFSMTMPDGTRHNGLGLIRLVEGLADDVTLRHEAVHLARRAGLIGESEWQALVDAHARGERNAAKQEELIAVAMEHTPRVPSVWDRIRRMVRGILNRLGITAYDAQDIHDAMADSAFWQRSGGKAGKRGISYQLRGRPDLANPATDAAARRQVDQVDMERDADGTPRPKSDVQTNAEADALLDADYAGLRREILRRGQNGELLNDAETVAAKKIMNREAAAAMASGDPAKIADATALIEAYRNTGTEEARALRQRRDPIESPAERWARMLTEAALTPPEKMRRRREKLRGEGDHEGANRINAQWAEEFERLKERLKDLGVDLENLHANGYSKIRAGKTAGVISAAKSPAFDKLSEYWRNAILSAPTTQAANLIGNMAHASWSMTAERLLEATFNTAMRQEGNATFGELKYLVGGVLPGLARGARNFWATFQTERPMLETQLGFQSRSELDDLNVAIRGRKGRAIRVPQRLLLAVDDFAKSLFTEMEVGARAHRIARSEELTGEDMQRRIAELTADVESPAWDLAYSSALGLAFQQRGSAAGQRVKKAALQARRTLPGMQYLIPFVTTPVNILETGLKKSPIGALHIPNRMYQNYSQGRHVLAGVPKQAAEQTLAWAAVLALLANDEEDPWITGTESQLSPELREVSYRSRPATSIKIGDRWVSYGRLEPFATAIGVAVDFTNSLRRGGPVESGLKMPMVLLNQIKSKTFLSGLGDMVKVLEASASGDPDRAWSEGSEWASSFATSWIPNLVRLVGRESEPFYANRRMWGKDEEYRERLARRTLQNTEVAPLADYPLYDVWGRPAKRSSISDSPTTDWLYRSIVPVRTQKDETFVADRLILNYNHQNSEAESFPRTPPPYYRRGGETHYLNDGQYADFVRQGGTAARLALEQFDLDPGNPTLAQVELIQEITTEAYGEVRDRLIDFWNEQGGRIDAAEIASDIVAARRRSAFRTIRGIGQPRLPKATAGPRAFRRYRRRATDFRKRKRRARSILRRVGS